MLSCAAHDIADGRRSLFTQHSKATMRSPGQAQDIILCHLEKGVFSHMPRLRSAHISGSRPRRRRCIETLHPEKLLSAGQQVLTLSGCRVATVRLNNRLADSLNISKNFGLLLHFTSGQQSPFPPETEGIFYYHSAHAQIRFRLCKTLEGFDRGSDLTIPDSRVWNVSLARMARNPSGYNPFLALLKHEFPIPPQDVEPNRDNHRLISTLSPQRLVTMNQRILKILACSVYDVILEERVRPE